MGIFHVFKIKQMVPNRVKCLKWCTPIAMEHPSNLTNSKTICTQPSIIETKLNSTFYHASLQFLKHSIHPFLAEVPILYHLKTAENQWSSDVLRRYKLWALARNRLRQYLWCVARFGTICTILKTWKTPMEECWFS